VVGPVVRINPYEIHISDPNFYDTVYVGSTTRKTEKWWWSVINSLPPRNVPGIVLK